MDPVMVNSERLWHGMDAGKMVDGCFDGIGNLGGGCLSGQRDGSDDNGRRRHGMDASIS